MIPDENIIPTYDVRLNRESELIAVPCITKEEETIKRHIQLFKFVISSRIQIVANDAIE